MTTTYLARLKVRVGKGLSTDDSTLSAVSNGIPISIRSAENDQPLKEATWVLVIARGFSTKSEAAEYGEKLRRSVHLVGLCTALGIDGRARGDDRTKTRITTAGTDFFQSLGVLAKDQRAVSDVHGLTVLEDAPNLRVFTSNIGAQASHDPARFVRAIEEASAGALSDEVTRAIEVLNLAYIHDSPIAKVVLAISSIEALAANHEEWSQQQLDTIDQILSWLCTHRTEGVDEVVAAIEKLRPRSLRQQAKRLLDEHRLTSLWPAWDEVYGRRSSLFHGGAGQEDDGSVTVLANDAVKICGRIVLEIARQQGAMLPSEAELHFDVHR